MRYCPNPDCPFLAEYEIVAEFQDSVVACPDCGSALVDGSAPAPHELPRARQPALVAGDVHFAALALFSNEEDVRLCLSRLHEARIPAVADDPDAVDETWHMRDAYGSARGKAVIVRESDLPRALATLAAIEEFWDEDDGFAEDGEAYFD